MGEITVTTASSNLNSSSSSISPAMYKKIVLVLCVCFFNEAFTFSNLFSYIGYMVWDFHLTDDVDQVGYYAGYLGSCFSLASFISSFWWGKMSDKYGKRPVLLIGATGATISCFIFGFSSSLYMAMATRFLSGLVNGNIGVVKGYTSNITDSTNQAKTMSYMQLSWGLGNIVGAMLGGVMARPCQQHPTFCSETSFLGRYPYALPNLINTFFSLFGLILLWWFIPSSSSSSSPSLSSSSSSLSSSSSRLLANSGGVTEDEGENIHVKQDDNYHQLEMSTIMNDDVIVIDNKKDEEEQGSISVTLCDTQPVVSDQKPFWKYHDAMMLVAAYGALGAAYTVFEEAWPLWALSPVPSSNNSVHSAGLGFTPSELGYVGAINGISAILIQITIFLPIVNKLGFLRLYQLGALLGIISFLPVPLLSHLVSSAPSLWSGLSALVVLRVFAGQCSFTACFGLLSNSIPMHHVGAVHGFAQSGVALTRAISPAVAGNLLAWGYSNGLGFPFNQYLVFFVASILSAVAGLLTLRLPTSLDVPYIESHPSSCDDNSYLLSSITSSSSCTTNDEDDVVGGGVQMNAIVLVDEVVGKKHATSEDDSSSHHHA